MTTVAGLHIENSSDEDFVILAADSRLTTTISGDNHIQEKTFFDGLGKITLPNSTKYMFCSSGSKLKVYEEPEIIEFYHKLSNKMSIYEPDFESKVISSIINGKSSLISELNQLLQSMDKSQNYFIFGMNHPDLGLYGIDEEGTSKKSKVLCSGSGSDVAKEFLDVWFDDKNEDISFLDAAILASNAIKKASIFDQYTGGSVNIALITNEGMELYKNVVDLSSDVGIVPHIVSERLSLKKEMKDATSAMTALKSSTGIMQSKYIDIICESGDAVQAGRALELADEVYHKSLVETICSSGDVLNAREALWVVDERYRERLVEKICSSEDGIQANMTLKFVGEKYHEGLVKMICSLGDGVQARTALEFVDGAYHESLVKVICSSEDTLQAEEALKFVDKKYHERLVKIICSLGTGVQARSALKFVDEKYHERLVETICSSGDKFQAKKAMYFVNNPAYKKALEQICN